MIKYPSSHYIPHYHMMMSLKISFYTVFLGSSSPLKQQALEEMRQTFTPEVAFLTYIPFCKLTGG